MNAMVNIEEKCANICLFYLYFLSLPLTKPVHSGQGGSRHRGKEAMPFVGHASERTFSDVIICAVKLRNFESKSQV